MKYHPNQIYSELCLWLDAKFYSLFKILRMYYIGFKASYKWKTDSMYARLLKIDDLVYR
jgi:hypothetical protein